MKEEHYATCPRCNTDLTEAHRFLGDKGVAFCLSCKFPLVLVAGKYKLESVIAEGGYGYVYRARHIYLEQDAERVVKILKPEVFEIPGMERRFYREVQVTSALSQKDEHVIRIYDDFGKIPNIGPFYVMEHLEGIRLDELLVESTLLPGLQFTLHIFRQLCNTMQHAHEAGVVHRDLKPENLFLIRRREDPSFLKILDFGIAKPINQQELKMTQGVLGSPFYMAPEQCLNQEVDERADIYSMACILFELLTGYPPFHPKHGTVRHLSLVEVLSAHISKPIPSPRDFRPDRVSGPLEEVLYKALEKEPSLRYQSSLEFLYALEKALNSLPTADYLPILHDYNRNAFPIERESHISPAHAFLPPSAFDETSQTLPPLGTVPSRVNFDGNIQVGGDLAGPTWEQIPHDQSAPFLRAFVKTIQNTLRNEEGIRYYRVLGILIGFLCFGAALGWWFYFPSSETKRGIVNSHTPRTKAPHPPSHRPPSPLLSSKVSTSHSNTPLPKQPPSRPIHPTPPSPPTRVVSSRDPVLYQKRKRTKRRTRRKYRHQRTTPPTPPTPSRQIVIVSPRPSPRPVQRPTPRVPVAGCPPAEEGTRWVRLWVQPSDAAASLKILQGQGDPRRRSNGFCLQLSSSVQVRIDAPEFRPCTFRLSLKHASLSIRLKKDNMDDIETNHRYCLQP